MNGLNYSATIVVDTVWAYCDIVKWCEKTVGSSRKWRYYVTIIGDSIYLVKFCFKDEADALMFKLSHNCTYNT